MKMIIKHIFMPASSQMTVLNDCRYDSAKEAIKVMKADFEAVRNEILINNTKEIVTQEDWCEPNPYCKIETEQKTIVWGMVEAPNPPAVNEDEIFRKMQYVYQLEDALAHLDAYLGVDSEKIDSDETKKILKDFQKKYGITYQQATDIEGENEILSRIVDIFNQKCDCNIPENDTYELSVEICLKQLLNS